MDHVALFLVALSVTVVLYGTLVVRHRWRTCGLRRIEAHIATVGVDPYYAASVRGEETAAAAAELLLDGLIRIDHHAVIRLAPRDGDDEPGTLPAHPVPAALLEAVRRRHPRHVVLGGIAQRDRAYHEQVRAFRVAQEKLLPGRVGAAGSPGGCVACLGCLGMCAVLAFSTFAAMAVLDSLPHGATQWAGAGGTCLALTLIFLSPEFWKRLPHPDPDPLRAHCLSLRHPALTGPDALDERRRRRLERSLALGRRTRRPRQGRSAR
ncbi:hypothetical protein M5362_10530 [Streptomyces sp. Je 1-79]|uniref:hypothetical protein n=1 Tax=Streptomyces sp. Je 1-79 TaxID=2943847 RepID=UPI0021A50971|nr:hypothetical protein [Streptomyces sp. Je 1-79]MCT4353562.1 hypothetical protein [Streptomyces sp. Je 1-79]